MEKPVKGTLFIISAPSGAGKTSLVQAVVEQSDRVQVSVSHTTRQIRSGEVDGLNYHFVSRDQFQEITNSGGFLEQAEVFGNYYGTSREWLEKTLDSGTDVILEIDWQGAEQVRKHLPATRTIFILPPSKATLEERLRKRGQDNNDIIKQRLAGAKKEIAHHVSFDYIVVNDDFTAALRDLKAIIHSSHLRGSNQAVLHLELLQDLLS